MIACCVPMLVIAIVFVATGVAGAGFIFVGFLLQWPTILTLLMFPVLVLVYRRLALREEQEVRWRFGAEWDVYAQRTPRFVPHMRHGAAPAPAPVESRREVTPVGPGRPLR